MTQTPREPDPNTTRPDEPSLTAEADWPRELLPGGEGFKRRVENPAMFRAYMLAKQPTLGVTTAYLDVIEVLHARMVLPPLFTSRDLFGRTASGAIISAAEMCSAALMMLNLRNQGATARPRAERVVLEAIDAPNQPELMTFETEEGERYGAMVARSIENRKTTIQEEFHILVRNAHGEPAYRVSITWALVP